MTLEVEAGLADAGEAEAGVNGVRSGLRPCCAEGDNERQRMLWGGVRQVGKRGLAAVVDDVIIPVRNEQVSSGKLHISCTNRKLDQMLLRGTWNSCSLDAKARCIIIHSQFRLSIKRSNQATQLADWLFSGFCDPSKGSLSKLRFRARHGETPNCTSM